MDGQLYDRQARRVRGRHRVRAVTSAVAVAATGLAVVLGVVFAKETASTSSDSGATTSDSGSTSDSGGSGWTAPDDASGSGGSAHGSSGGS